MAEHQHLVVMGVAGCGKTTVAQLLAERLGWTVAEADEFHPTTNIAKMASGDSFFLEGKKPKEVMFLYQAAYAVDAKLQIVAVEVDEVYMTAGTRVKRVS